MRYRNMILVGFGALVAVMVSVVLLLVTRELDREAREDLRGSVDRASQVFAENRRLHEQLLAARAGTVAEEPRLKAVVATEDIDAATVRDVAEELMNAAKVDVFILTDPGGVLVADATNPKAKGSLADRPLVATALKEGSATGAWVEDTTMFLVHAERLAFGDTTVGVLILGQKLSDDFLASVSTQTGVGLVLSVGGDVVARAGEPTVEAKAVLGAATSKAPQEFAVPGDTLVVAGEVLPWYREDAQVEVRLFRSRAVALAPSRALIRSIVLLGLLSLVAGGVLAFVLAGRLSQPLEGLVTFTKRVGEGDMDARANATGPVEVTELGKALDDMVQEIASARENLMAKERLESEMAIATRIQTSILPPKMAAPGLEFAAEMIPASEVGGDYYDVQPAPFGCWIGIGDVAGHGLPAGLVMMMVQSCFAMISRDPEELGPGEAWRRVNSAVYDAVRQRLGQDEHVTLTLFRYLGKGAFLFAGAHEDILVWRAKTGEVEAIETTGVWLGIVDAPRPPQEHDLQLEPGDVMLLYTDGVTERMNEQKELLGLDRVRDVLKTHAAEGPMAVRDAVVKSVQAWSDLADDDVTLLVVKYTG